MKKKLLILLVVVVCSLNFANAQSVPNGAFENWTSINYDDLNGWYSSNTESLKNNIVTASKVAGSIGFAIKLETKIMGPDTMGGFCTNTLNGDPTTGKGGVPYNQKAETFSGKYMANMVGNDSALILVMFKKAGVPLSMDFFKLGGKNQTTFSSFTFNLNLQYIPDSVIIAMASSNLETRVGIANGSSIVFDELSFAGLGVTKTIPNGSFENWTANSKPLLTGWNALQGIVSKDTTRYKGNYAVKMQSIDHGFGDIETAQITSGNMGPNGFLIGGNPFSNMVDTLCGYYKLISPTGDSAMITYNLSKNGGFLMEQNMSLKPTSTYTYFQFPINAVSQPDNIRIDVQSLFYPFSYSAKSTLYLDELQLKSAPLKTGLIKFNAITNYHSFYPNPVTNELTIQIENGSDLLENVQVFDLSGKLVLSVNQIQNNQVNLNTSDLNAGVYFYFASTKKGETFKNKFIKN